MSEVKVITLYSVVGAIAGVILMLTLVRILGVHGVVLGLSVRLHALQFLRQPLRGPPLPAPAHPGRQPQPAPRPMSAPANSFTIWTEKPRYSGFSWLAANLVRTSRLLWVAVLSRFISLLGTLSAPGMKPAGLLQAWALRRMGVKCPSNHVWIGPSVHFDYPQKLELGRRVTIGPESRITAWNRIVIGDDFLGAPGLMLNTGSHDLATLVPQSAPIVIGAGVGAARA